MKHLKKINELFDDENLKSKFEIPFLKGEMSPDKLAKGKDLLKVNDPLLLSLVRACPFLMELGYRRVGKTLSFGFDDTKVYSEEDQVFYYFFIEITEFGEGKYNLISQARCVGNDQVIYNESEKFQSVSIIELYSKIKGPVFRLLVDFDNWLEEMFDEDYFSLKDRDIVIFDPGMN